MDRNDKTFPEVRALSRRLESQKSSLLAPEKNSPSLVLINPLKSCGHYDNRDERGLPTVEQIRQLTDNGIRVIFVDNVIEKRVAPSVLDVHPGHRELLRIRAESVINPFLYLFNVTPSFWDWKIDGFTDLRQSDGPVVYVDYTKYYKFGPDLNDELVIMARVVDFKSFNRKYLRNVPYSDLFALFQGPIEANEYFYWENAISPGANREVYRILINSLAYYLNNDFHLPDPEIEFGRMQTNLIKTKEVVSYPLVMSHPMLKGFVHRYGLLPPIPVNDHLSYKSTGLNPTRMMTGSNQYRRVVTTTLASVLGYMLTQDGTIESGTDMLDPEFVTYLKEQW